MRQRSSRPEVLSVLPAPSWDTSSPPTLKGLSEVSSLLSHRGNWWGGQEGKGEGPGFGQKEGGRHTLKGGSQP